VVGEDIGFERRLLASVRWTLATAVASPQRSESVLQIASAVSGDAVGGGFEELTRNMPVGSDPSAASGR